ncbi:unnamed protein product [Ceutorhynchus assimilis]|uniref:Uncharacterized protein n=1 Tax=Ceutorhynchus assimilis TaxID=467358 RepID=A0A9N9MHD8_9CUCU|nr:unnamed protein product [Ceutorhynchus assimilis]
MRNLWKFIAGSVVVGTATYSLVKYFAGGVCNCPTRLDGLLVIITGANSGIGKALAIELAKRGANLILACRNVKKGLQTKTEILEKVENRSIKIYVKHLDLCSIKSISEFADIIKLEFKELFALVNNAGVFYHPQQLTEDGFDVTFQTNYLGPFVLTHLLIPHLDKQVHARVINVASEAHRMVNVYDLKAITTCQKEFRSHFIAYGVSKLALILFTKELAKKLLYTNVIINAVNPGNVETPIYRHFPALSSPWLFALQKPLRLIVVKSPKQGCQTLLHALLTSNRSTGQYYSDCKLSLASPIASSDKIAKEYYEMQEEWISPDDKVFKRLISLGEWGLKPFEYSIVKLNILDCPNELLLFNNVYVTLGDNDGELGRLLDICVCTMNLKEKAEFRITVGLEEVFAVIELVELEFRGFIFQWSAKQKFEMALMHKEKGAMFFAEKNQLEAGHRFNKALKLLCSIPINVQVTPEFIDNVSTEEIKLLKAKLYNNLSSCYFREKVYSLVIPLCLKVLASDCNNVKALYKLGVAYENDKNFEKAFEALSKAMELEPHNKACAEHLAIVNLNLKKANVKVNDMMKKMFISK